MITDPETKPVIAEPKKIVVAQQTGIAQPVFKVQFEVLEKLLA